jgi:hypothetical protein
MIASPNAPRYNPHRSASRSQGSFSDHEPSLWRAVITQALMDAATASRKAEARRIRADAIDWLLSPSDDFDNVCDNAGLDPDYVRARAASALERNCAWRLPAGQGWRARARLAAAQPVLTEQA